MNVDSLGSLHKLPSTRTSHGWLSPTSSRLYLVDGTTPQKTAVADELKQMTALAKPNAAEPSLNNLLENMPLPEKYALLLQSYATNIMDSTNRTVEAMNTMETLFTEMLGKSILPSEKSSKLLIDAASTFCNSIKLGKSLQLSKAAGSLRAFGAINGQLTVPIVSASTWKAVMGDAKVPFDDREAEVWYATFTVGAGVLWVALQVGSAFVSDIQLYSTLFLLAAVGLVGLDVALRQGKSLKLASAGLERLILKDAERETHCDGAAFLVGYLLGLPCFCFRPDVGEALKMLRDSPESLEVYRQPKAVELTSGGGVKKAASGGFDLFGMMTPSATGAGKGVPGVPAAATSSTGLAAFALPAIPADAGGEDMIGLGRVLVWLMAPVAAEYLKYGKTVVADPRRSVRLLKVLEAVQTREKKEKGGTSASASASAPAPAPASASASAPASVDSACGGVCYVIPGAAEDQDALLQWAYYEASTLIKQYGDLLEGVNGYLGTGTSTVGECVMLVEEELR